MLGRFGEGVVVTRGVRALCYESGEEGRDQRGNDSL